MITPKSASRLFIERVIVDIYKGTFDSIEAQIAEGLPGQVDDASETEQWYQNLDENNKRMLMEVLGVVIKETIFGFLVTLDNLSGGPPLKGRISDFAIYVQSYNDLKAKAENRFQEAVRFNAVEDEELHDLFLYLLSNSQQE